jgi:poly(A) polymerase
VHDHVGGLADLEARRVHFIGDSARRIAEDYLRILRFFRFHAFYGAGALDPAGLAACIAARGNLTQLSRERVRMELMKLMLAPHAVPALAVMSEIGILGPVLGGVPQLASLSNMIKLEAACGLEPAAARRLGALAVWVVEDAERLGQRLRLTNAERARLASVGEAWWRLHRDLGEEAARALIYRLGPERFVERALLAWTRAREGAADEKWHALVTLPQRWSPPTFPLKAADLMARGIAQGPALGRALAAAEAAWIAAGFPANQDELARIADAAVRQVL